MTSSGLEKVEKGKDANKAKGDNKSLFNRTKIKEPGKSKFTDKWGG